MTFRFSFLKKARSRPGFAGRVAGLSIVEGVGMVILAGILAGMAYPAISGLRQSGLNQQAIGVAQAINQAQQTYNLRVANAETTWEAASDSSAKYQLIWQYIPYAATSLSAYSPSGYTLTLGATLNTKVAIVDANGNPVSY
ncbi:MAG TPA: hypothetical protein VFE31_11360 [Opitutaceae bacterium]|jgi:type II secretory pathway pseudopilin PulG|nr:hypothetical protein [Opitutaceae bacterium]